MFKKNFKKILLAGILVAIFGGLVFGAVSRTLAKANSEDAQLVGNGAGTHGVGSGNETSGTYEIGQGYGNTGSVPEAVLDNLPAASTSSLTAAETAALLYMREEEKLARDVYLTLAAKWNLPIFQNISGSEQVHTDAIKTLLDRYGVSDPAASRGVGEFTNPDFRSLYQELVAGGNQSLAAALKVGAAIEEIDILDLEKYLSQTDKTDLQQVFHNLESGSYSHLNAFVATLFQQTGETYPPQYLSLEAYQAILGTNTGSVGRGGSGGGYHGGRP